MDYTFLLVNYNMSGLVDRCIAMLSECVPNGASYEIMLANNGTDECVSIENKRYASFSVVRAFTLPDFTFSQCLNYLIARSSCKWIVMMHPDVEFKPGCLDLMTEFMEEHPKAGAASPDIYYPTGEPTQIRLRFPNVTTEIRRLFNTISYILFGARFLSGEMLWDRSDAVVEADMLMSVAMLVRKKMIDEVGPFDERIHVYYLNDYLCAQGRIFGWKCYYLREAIAIHFERYSSTSLFSTSDKMKYKTDPVSANPRMRADFIQFLRTCQPAHKAAGLRLLALANDVIGLISQLRHYRTRRANVKAMWQSVRVLCGLRP